MRFHLCIPAKKGLELIRKGENIFTDTPIEAHNALIRQEMAGKEFFTGCDNEDDKGMCAGHPQSGDNQPY